jgi:hypothetical protein
MHSLLLQDGPACCPCAFDSNRPGDKQAWQSQLSQAEHMGRKINQMDTDETRNSAVSPMTAKDSDGLSNPVHRCRAYRLLAMCIDRLV